MTKVWIVGKTDETDYLRWEFQGVFDDEQEAINVCEDETWFVGPAQMNERISSRRVDWPGAYYPRVTQEEKMK